MLKDTLFVLVRVAVLVRMLVMALVLPTFSERRGTTSVRTTLVSRLNAQFVARGVNHASQ